MATEAKAATNPWLTISEAARRTGISPRTLRYWALQGRLPAFRPGGPGGRYFLLADSLVDFLAASLTGEDDGGQ